MSLHRARSVVRELVALSRNYRHAAILRRHVRTRYGAAPTVRPSTLIGEVLAAAHQTFWKRVAVLTVLFLVATRR